MVGVIVGWSCVSSEGWFIEFFFRNCVGDFLNGRFLYETGKGFLFGRKIMFEFGDANEMLCLEGTIVLEVACFMLWYS